MTHSTGGGSSLGTVDHVDTSNFPEAIRSIETMATTMRDLVANMDDYKALLIDGWVGKGRNQFEKSYRIIKRKVEDGTDLTWDMYENLMTSAEVLYQNDVDVANGIKTYK